jgi:serine/threonine protein kinase
LGEDYNYSVRLGQLQFIRELGAGGFGVVNLMYDSLEKKNVAVKFISFR